MSTRHGATRAMLLALLAGACLAACAPTGSRGPSPALVTIVGTVTAGPTCPVERLPPASACFPRPVQDALISIRDTTGSEVRSVRSGAGGTFTADLPPGTYRLVPQPVSGLLGTAPPVTIDVSAGSSAAPVEIQYDTGIR